MAREVTVTVLATTDMHGNIYPYDYLTGQAAARGLAKISTLVKAERKISPARCSSIAETPFRDRSSKACISGRREPGN
jgi:hypothetical protein